MVNLISHLLAAFAFLGLIGLLLVARQPGRVGNSLLAACAFSVAWAVLALLDPELFPFTGISESMRILSWTFFLAVLTDSQNPANSTATSCKTETISISGSRKPDQDHPWARRMLGIGYPGSGFFRLVLLLAALQITLTIVVVSPLQPPQSLDFLLPTVWISATIGGLACLENVYRGTASEKRRALKPLCIGLAGMFILDFLVFTDTLLFRRINSDVWQARGFFYAFLVPVIAITVARNPDWAVRIHVSRQAVTSSIAVIGTGGYLLATAVAAYLIKLSGVEWANVAQIAFILISLVILVLALVSSRLRAQLRVNVSKHLFNFKYDYRREWLNFTRILATDIGDAPIAIVQGLTQIMHSESGELWAKNLENDWELLASRGPRPHYRGIADQWNSLEAFMRRTGWIVQLDEYKVHPERYTGLALPEALEQCASAWLIIPLPDGDDIIGFVIIDRSSVIQSISWEDRDLLKTAGQQAAGFLVQRRSQEALLQARQFEAFSKLSAYVIHDLKNILGQQSLIVSNAARHKHKPAFVDDVIYTVENSVNRMQSLLEKLREQQSNEKETAVDLAAALHSAMQLRPFARPQPTLEYTGPSISIAANENKLIRVFGHIIHNAQDATTDTGTITVSLDASSSIATIAIADDGTGMTEDFINNSLFKPFVSSKGLTGMGIGAYESREYISKLGGKIFVSSQPGEGTVFTITLPTIG